MNRIAELRKERGWSQSKLAEYIGVAQNTLSQYENGQRNLSSRTLMQLVDIFGANPAYIMGESDARGLERPKSFDLQLATKIIAESDVSRVNLYLLKGWKLIHVGEEMEFRGDRSEGYSSIVYSLAWFDYPQHPSAHELGDEMELGPDGFC